MASKIIAFIHSLTEIKIIIFLKFIFLFVSGVLFFFILFFLLRLDWLKDLFWERFVEFFTYRPFGVKPSQKKWQKILQRLESDNKDEYKVAINEADDFLNDVLTNIGISGETLEDKLMKADKETLPEIEKIKAVHNEKDRVVYDPDYNLSKKEAEKIIKSYEEIFQKLEVF